jgi:hypothetical protein
MSVVNSKQKGSAFEREVCRELSLWVSKGSQEDVFWRSATSGGRSTVAAKKGLRLATQAGDISCIHQIGAPFIDKFLVECKNYADLNFVGLLLKRKGHLAEFWSEVCTQADRYGKEPLLIAHQSRQPIIACTTRQGGCLLNLPLMGQCIFHVPDLGLEAYLFEMVLKYGVAPHE